MEKKKKYYVHLLLSDGEWRVSVESDVGILVHHVKHHCVTQLRYHNVKYMMKRRTPAHMGAVIPGYRESLPPGRNRLIAALKQYLVDYEPLNADDRESHHRRKARVQA